jgi:penicillin-binding protein 2
VRDGEIIEQNPPVEPIPGDSITLTIDLELQELVELALEKGVALSNQVKDAERAAGEEVFSETKRAAAVVLDVNTFEVLALASYPDFDPSSFVTGIDDQTFNDLTNSFAFNNLAISGLYPPASTFKAITYTAIEEENLPFPTDIEGVDAPNRLVHCDGTLLLSDLQDGSVPQKKDWYNPLDLGWLDLHGALENSCNIYFWTMAMGIWQKYKETPRENVLQNWAKDLGYGSLTGIDLGSEAAGTVPTREWMEDRAEYQREHPDEPPLIEPARLELASPWLGGDLLDFAIGQGAFTATPLQVAMSYAVLANGGKVMEPRVVEQVTDSDGNVVFAPPSDVIRNVDISESTRRDLLTDLNHVVTTGTAATAFAEFGKGLDKVGGKTGTGQSSETKDNHAWFVGVAPINNPKYVVAIIIEEGGSGGRIAAPVGRQIMQYLMGNKPTAIVEGEEAQ